MSQGFFMLSFVCTHHCHTVIEQRLSKHHDEEDLVDVDLLKHGDDGYGVHSSDQTAEQKILQQTNIQVTCSTQGRRWWKSGLHSILSQKSPEETGNCLEIHGSIMVLCHSIC